MQSWRSYRYRKNLATQQQTLKKATRERNKSSDVTTQVRYLIRLWANWKAENLPGSLLIEFCWLSATKKSTNTWKLRRRISQLSCVVASFSHRSRTDTPRHLARQCRHFFGFSSSSPLFLPSAVALKKNDGSMTSHRMDDPKKKHCF